RNIRKILSLFFVLTFFVASATIASAEEGPIVIGSIWSQVGIAAPLGQAGLRGTQLAVKLANEQGGVIGHKLELKNIDGQSDTTVISNAAIRLVEESKVIAACGLTDDSLVSAAGPIFQEGKTVFLDGTATTPTIPSIGDFIFMTPFGDNYQGQAVAKYCAHTLGWKKVAVIWDNASAYSTDLSNFFMDAFKAYTKDDAAIAHQEIYQTGDVNFTAQLTRLKTVIEKEKIEGIVITPPFPQDGPIIAKQAEKLGIKLPIVLTDGADDQSVVEVGGPSIEGAIVSTHFAAEYPLTENAKKFVEAYRAEYNNEPGAFECLGFDAVNIMLESIETIGKEKWDSMSLEEQRVALRDTIQSHKFVKTTMPISYPDPQMVKYPRVPLKPVVFKEFKGGQRVYKDIIYPEDL
ncbi:ABC transporter substrate-binding protein, partial [Aminobacterium sp. UBA5277]